MARQPLHTTLPPLLLGTATFNTQYVPDPHAMPYRAIVSRALALGINGFDTSPYYGPSELLLGDALSSLSPQPPRSSYTLVTKVGRVKSTEFDYSAAHVRASINRSLARLRTDYVDLVYAHDAEFVSPDEVVEAVRELRQLRDGEGKVRYVGISGFPVDVLCELAEKVLRETGEPLDAVLSYGHFTVQNRRLRFPWGEPLDAGAPLSRFKKAGVDVVLNASMLGMGLLTTRGIPATTAVDPSTSPLAVWHPSPPELRKACAELARIAERHGERLESVSIRWSLEEWARVGADADVGVDFPVAGPGEGPRRIGATVCGVSSVAELEETVAEWRGALRALWLLKPEENDAYGRSRQAKVMELVHKELWPALGSWLDYAWKSPDPGFVNQRSEADRGTIVPDVPSAVPLEQRDKRTLPVQPVAETI